MADSKVFNLDSGITAMNVAQAVEGFFEDKKGLLSEVLETQHGIIIQAKQKSTWKKFVGMDNSVQVQIFDQKTSVIVEVGAGKWIDKAGAATVGVLVFPPLAVTAAVGAWVNKKLPEEIFDFVERFIVSGGRMAGVSMRKSDALKTSEVLCPSCGARNADGTKFCSACGAKLTAECPSCGAAVKPGIKFCSGCGANLQEETRKAQEAAVVRCASCEAVIPDGNKFCPNCGAPAPVKLADGTALCSQCRKLVSASAKFCPECGGTVIQKAAPKCPQCGTTAEEGTKFCPECGAALAG